MTITYDSIQGLSRKSRIREIREAITARRNHWLGLEQNYDSKEARARREECDWELQLFREGE